MADDNPANPHDYRALQYLYDGFTELVVRLYQRIQDDLVDLRKYLDNVLSAAPKTADPSVVSLPDGANPITRLGAANVGDVQKIAALQSELLNSYYQAALAQSNRSFFWALIGSGLGLSLFIVAVVFALVNGIGLPSVVPLLSGAMVEVVSGVVFYLYGQTSSQLNAFQKPLELQQRYLLANSICEHLDKGEVRNVARSELIRAMIRSDTQQP